LIRRATTLADVARRVGVTEMTVSAALRGVGRISKETRGRIIDAARELGYRPNAAARSMRSGRFNCLALLVSQEHPSGMPYGMLDGMHDAMTPRNLHLTLSRLGDEKLTDRGFVPKMLREAMADGLLVKYDQRIPQRMVELFRRYRLPAVWINSKHDSDCVYPDDVAAGRQATEHLLGMGHRRIAFVCYVGAGHYSPLDRFEGYSLAMGAAGLEATWLDRRPDGLSRRDRVGAISQWLRQPGRPTGVVVNSPTSAKILLLGATRLGLRVPRDLSIVTFSDMPTDDCGVAIDTLTLPARQMGRQAVEMLLAKIDDPTAVHAPRALPWRLAPGQTCGPPQGDGASPLGRAPRSGRAGPYAKEV